MADDQSQMSQGRSHDAWLVGAVALGAILAVSVVAVALVVLLGPKAPQALPAINNSTTNNFQLPSKGEASAPNQPSTQRKTALNRADPSSPPFSKLSSNAPRVYLRLQAAPIGAGSTQGPLPMPVRYSTDAQGRVGGIYASVPGGGADEAAFSYLPDKVFADARVQAAALELSLSELRKTSTWGPYRAPKDFQFFAVKVAARNPGRAPLQFNADDFEVRDSDGLRYLPTKELLDRFFAGSLAPSGSASFEVAFLVPAEAPLSALQARVPGGGVVQAKLNAR